MRALIASVLIPVLLPAQQMSTLEMSPRPYRVEPAPPLRLANSVRWENLLREGKIYLSLEEAMALGLENNLDLAIVRYAPQFAAADEMRARAGGALRGVPLTVREGPQGIGGPNVTAGGTLGGGDAPGLASLGNPGVQTDLSLIGSLPLSTGTNVPVFDPLAYGQVNHTHTSAPQNSAFFPGLRSINSDITDGAVGVQKGFSTGALVDFNFNSQHWANNSPLLNYNPYHTTALSLSLTQPLLRGFGAAVNKRYIRIAKNNSKISERVFEQQVIATVAAIIRMYWDLVSLNQDVEVRREAVTSAERLLEDNKSQVEAGTLAPIDVTRAKAELARRQRDLAVADSLVRQQEAVMKDYLTRVALTPELQKARIVPTDTIQIPEREDLVDIEALVAKAYERRPDLAQAKMQVENSEISLKGSRSALLPALDVVASARNNGLAGDVSTVPGPPGSVIGTNRFRDPLLTGGYGSALAQVFRRNFPDYAVGARLSIPLTNQAARADVVRDQLAVRQQELRLQQLYKQVRLEVTNAQIALEQARASWQAIQQERVLGEQTLEAEKEKLSVGASTMYVVIQHQRDLAALKSSEVAARSTYMKARTALERAAGMILEAYAVKIEEARQKN